MKHRFLCSGTPCIFWLNISSYHAAKYIVHSPSPFSLLLIYFLYSFSYSSPPSLPIPFLLIFVLPYLSHSISLVSLIPRSFPIFSFLLSLSYFSPPFPSSFPRSFPILPLYLILYPFPISFHVVCISLFFSFYSLFHFHPSLTPSRILPLVSFLPSHFILLFHSCFLFPFTPISSFPFLDPSFTLSLFLFVW